MTQVLTEKKTQMKDFFIKRKSRKVKTIQDFQNFLIPSGKTQKENVSENIDTILY